MTPHTSKLTHRQRTAMTLVEMLCVLVILAIVTILVLPRTGAHDAQRLRSAAGLLLADIAYAQIQSIGNGVDPCVLVFDDEASQYHLARQSDVRTPLRDPGSGQPFVTRFGEGRAAALDGVLLDALEVGDDDLLGFTASGTIDQGSDARIVLRLGDTTIGVVVDAGTGRASIEQ